MDFCRFIIFRCLLKEALLEALQETSRSSKSSSLFWAGASRLEVQDFQKLSHCKSFKLHGIRKFLAGLELVEVPGSRLSIAINFLGSKIGLVTWSSCNLLVITLADWVRSYSLRLQSLDSKAAKDWTSMIGALKLQSEREREREVVGKLAG